MVESGKKLIGFDQLLRTVIQRFEKDTGNQLSGKESKVEFLLLKRMGILGDVSVDTYVHEYLNKAGSDEYNKLVSELTVHYTYFFFREFLHFDYLLSNLSNIVSEVKAQNRSKIKILSAGCSMGHEVYSLATFFSYHLRNYPSIDFEIDGYDIDPESVKKAKKGIYALKELKNVPKIYISGFWQKSANPNFQIVKIKDDISSKVNFEVGNILKVSNSAKKYDFIFCRNVLIYFSAEERVKILQNFESQLEDTGEVVLGASDFVPEEEIKLKRKTHSIFTKPGVHSFIGSDKPQLQIVESDRADKSISKISRSEPSKVAKLLIVDDSPTVRKILKKIFMEDPSFEVVGEAENGVAASEFLKQNEVDVMTLDIHMPLQLKNNRVYNDPKEIDKANNSNLYDRSSCISIFGNLNVKYEFFIDKFKKEKYVLLEDLGLEVKNQKIVQDHVPATSFWHIGTEHLATFRIRIMSVNSEILELDNTEALVWLQFLETNRPIVKKINRSQIDELGQLLMQEVEEMRRFFIGELIASDIEPIIKGSNILKRN